jgi:hypothetical protein
MQPVEQAVRDWKTARAREAVLAFYLFEDGGAEIVDTRMLPETSYLLTPDEACLYRFLDSARSERALATTFGRTHPIEAQALIERGGVETVIDNWQQAGLVISDQGRVLALAVNVPEIEIYEQASPSKVSLPFPYAGEGTIDIRLNRRSAARRTALQRKADLEINCVHHQE